MLNFLLAKFQYRTYVVSVAELVGLRFTWSQTLKLGFLMMLPIWFEALYIFQSLDIQCLAFDVSKFKRRVAICVKGDLNLDPQKHYFFSQ